MFKWNFTITSCVLACAFTLLCSASMAQAAENSKVSLEDKLDLLVKNIHVQGEPAFDALAFRQYGQDGVYALDRVYTKLKELQKTSRSQALNERIARLEATMDQVTGQRYGSASLLFWHTDLESAKAESLKRNKPILSLRMLGNLTEEFSCANSRFFRTILYVDPLVNYNLRNNFVLHWQSVRDVPKVTVTLADGSVMQRTVTGNSVHMVLKSDGEIINIIPGLWAPHAFVEELNRTANVLKTSSRFKDAAVDFRSMHSGIYGSNNSSYEAALKQVNMKREDLQEFMPPAEISQIPGFASAPQTAPSKNSTLSTPSKPSTAVRDPFINANAPQVPAGTQIAVQPQPAAPQEGYNLNNLISVTPTSADGSMPRAVMKSRGEAVFVEPIQMVNVATMWQRINNAKWQTFAAQFEKDIKLSEESLALIAKENPGFNEEMHQAIIKSLASDTAFNRFFLGQQIHQWFATAPQGTFTNDPQVTQTLYRDVLGMDLNDPWAGLYDPNVYTGLNNAGMAERKQISSNNR